jgi:hypothetical protein
MDNVILLFNLLVDKLNPKNQFERQAAPAMLTDPSVVLGPRTTSRQMVTKWVMLWMSRSALLARQTKTMAWQRWIQCNGVLVETPWRLSTESTPMLRLKPRSTWPWEHLRELQELLKPHEFPK